MAKKLLATGFRIDRNNNSIFIEGNILLQRLLLITDVTTNRIIYNFADEGSGVLSINYDNTARETRLVFRQSLAALGVANTDVLQILVENESSEFRPEDPFIDPVSKLRISQPENLIDTDFEYGLQSTKWETLKLVNNVPSFYSKNGADPISASSVQSTAGSSTVLVTAFNHGLAAGTPFEITGLSNSQFEGGYIVTSVISANQFTYQLTFNSQVASELSTVYTNVVPGAFYFGSQITVSDIETDGLNPSKLTVSTKFPHGFSFNTPFNFLNTVAIYRQDIPVSDFNLDDTVTNQKTTTSTSIGESTQDYRITSVTPYRFVGKSTFYFDNSNIETRLNAPVTSARVVNGGAGYVSSPVAIPVFATGVNVNSNTFNSTSTGVVIGTGANAGRITLAQATTLTTGDQVEYHTEGASSQPPVASPSIIRDPFSWISSGLFMGEQSVEPGAVGYSPQAFATGVAFQGASIGATQANLTLDPTNFAGRLAIGQEIRIFRINTGTTPPTLLTPEGCKILTFVTDNNILTITIRFPFPLASSIAFSATTAFFAASIDTVQNTITANSHGFVTGDRVYYRRVVTTTGTVPATSPALADPGGIVSSTPYFVIRVDANTYKLATTYENSIRGINLSITNIGSGAFNTANARFLPGFTFTASSTSLFVRVLTGTTVQLHPTRNDALNNTNVITYTTQGAGTAHRLSAMPAVFSTVVSGSTVSSVSVITGGSAYDRNASVVVQPYTSQRSIDFGSRSGGTAASGSTNSLTFRSTPADTAIYTGQRVTGVGIPANTFVNTVSSPDENNIVTVQLNQNINATINHGNIITFQDNSGSAAVIMPNIRVSCFNIPSHGYELGDALFFYNPPGNTFPTSITASRNYFVYPIDEDNFALIAAAPSAFSAAVSNTRVVLNTGTVVENRKFVLTRSFRIVGNGFSNTVRLTQSLSSPNGLEVGDSFIATTALAAGTMGNVTVTSAVDATVNNTAHTLFVARSLTNNGFDLQFSTTTTGPLVSAGIKTGEVFVTPVVLLAESDSVFVPNHGFNTNDYVIYTATDTAIGGPTATSLAAAGTNGYLVSKVSNDRFKLLNPSNNSVIDLRTFGTGSHIFTNTKFSSRANTVFKEAHGFLANQTVLYDSAGAPIVDGLVNTQEYFIKAVDNDSFRVSSTTQELQIIRVAKLANVSNMTVEFNINHSLAVGDTIIIRDNLNPYVNSFWTVSSVPVSPVINGAPSSVVIDIPVFMNPAPVITQPIVTNTTYGIAFKYIDLAKVVAQRSIITPVPAGKTFTTLKAIDGLITKKTPTSTGGGIVTSHLVDSSTVLPLDSRVVSVTGTNVRTSRVLFKPVEIASATRLNDVVTVTTTRNHGYDNNQTVVIQGLDTESFNIPTSTPVTITVTGNTTFTFAQEGDDATVVGDIDSLVVMALTQQQADLLAGVGNDASIISGAGPTIPLAAIGALSVNAPIASPASTLSNITKTLPALAGLINQFTLTVPNTDDLKPGMPVVGAGINLNSKIIKILSPTQIELSHPNTANTTASVYTFFLIQAGQEVRQVTPNASTVAGADASSSTTFAVKSATGIVASMYVDGNRSTTTFAATAAAGNTFEVASTSNIFEDLRVQTPAAVTSSVSYNSSPLFTAVGNVAGTSGFANIRSFKADSGNDIYTSDDPRPSAPFNAIRLVQHPFVSGDVVRYFTNGGNDIGGLTNTQTYFVIRLNDNFIQLATTLENATAETPVPIVLTGYGSGSSQYFRSNVVWGNSFSNAGATLNEGHHVNATTAGFTNSFPQGSVVLSKRTISGASAYRSVAFVVGVKDQNDVVSTDSVPLSDAFRLGDVGSTTGDENVINTSIIRAGFGNVGNRIFTDSTTNLQVGMVPTLIAGFTAGAFVTTPVATFVTSIAANGKSFTVNQAPSTPIRGAKINAGAGSVVVTLTVTATTATTNRLTTTGNTNTLQINTPVVFTGTTFGGIVTTRVYYVKEIVSSTQFTVSETISEGVAGAVRTLTTATGSMVLNSNIVYLSSTTGIVPGMSIEMVTQSAIDGITGAFSNTSASNDTRVSAVIDGFRIALTNAPSTPLAVARVVTGVSSGTGGTSLPPTSRIFVPSATGFRVGQVINLLSQTAGALVNPTSFATQTVVQAVDNTNPLKPFIVTGTMVEATGVISVGNAPGTRLQGAVIAAGASSANPGTTTIRVPSAVGLNTGMTVEILSGTGTLALSTTIQDINPVNNTFLLSATPTTALANASIRTVKTNAVVPGLFVVSTEPNFPEDVVVTAVNGNVVTINDTHGGVTLGTNVTFSPFAVGTYVTGVSGLNISLNQAHAGLFGGTFVNFNRLPPRTFLGEIPTYNATTWTLRLDFSRALNVAKASEQRTISFTGSNKNLGDNVAFKTFGTHIFTRSSDADGVYNIESVPSPTSFVVNTGSTIPFNTKSFTNSEINVASSFIRITNHKFRDGTSLIYRPGDSNLIQTESYIDKDGDTQTTLIGGQTYYAVVVDPNFVKLAPTFDEAVSDVPTTITLTSGTNGTQSFDTFSILGLTRGLGSIIATEESDIIAGNGTKFLTNFKGGDVLRFYTAANPGKIFNYIISSVKSDTSIKLRGPVQPDAVVKVNLIVDRTVDLASTIAVPPNAQTIRLNSVADLAPGYLMFDSLGRFKPNTRIVSINTSTRVVTLSETLNSNFAVGNAISIQPLFEYFISTNIYVKSNATTTHLPFDGGVSMTTGLVPDSSIVRQSRKYFRYQSGKGIQVSIAVNFNPPTDVESLTSVENIATVTVDVPHGFQVGTTNRIRVTDATVPAGHNGYNGQYNVAQVIDDYTFSYVYEDTALFGTVTNNSNTITAVWEFNGVAVGKTIKAGTYGPVTVPANTIITNINVNTKVITLNNPLTGSSPTVDISSINRVNDTVTVITDEAHGLVDGDYVSIGGTGVGAGFNGFSAPVEVIDNTTFTFTQVGVNTTPETEGVVIKQLRLTIYRQNGSSIAYGFPKYNLVEWKDAAVRAGLFDSQNGMYFEYDGQQIYCVRRSSVQQIAGKINSTYRSSLITGTNTRFTTQLSVGEFLVIRGMSYKVIGIDSDTQLFIQPEYRGSSLNNIIGTKTVDTRVPQSQWNLDKADGFGRSGYILDLNKIQMVYIDYSWYGAGKIRFGFKDQRGEVRYFHEFIHNNDFVEAYMRSGNIPCRYEVVTFGEPTFSPSLFHWGTSVIMDGRFDDDKAYLFTADSNVITLTNGGTATAPSLANTPINRGDNFFLTTNANSTRFIVGSTIRVQNDFNNADLPAGTVVRSVSIVPGTANSRVTLSQTFRRNISGSAGGTTFIVGGGTNVSSIADLSPIPLVSIRLAPSVDNGLTGDLGFRDIINRMQLTLNSCGVLLTHESEIRLFLNSDLSDSSFQNNSAPSLSQIYKHTAGETIRNGIQLFSFRASGGPIAVPATGQRSLVQTTEQLGEVAQLGNAILGGDETFPNGPDILTITATPIDTSTINGNAPFQASARITWSESQA
jgi:hypothetical protein